MGTGVKISGRPDATAPTGSEVLNVIQSGVDAKASLAQLLQVIAGINVKDPAYGAKGDGNTDDTVAIQAAIDAATGTPSSFVFFPPGNFKVGPLVVKTNGVHLVGSGVFATQLTFTPTGNTTTPGSGTADPGTCLQFCKTAGSAILYNCSIENIFIYSTDTSLTKNGIRIVETSGFEMRRVLIQGFYGGDSVGLQTMGHEVTLIDTVHIEACIPIRVSKSPTAYFGVYYSGDHMHFANLYLIAGTATNVGTAKYFPLTLPSACVLIDDAVFMSNVSFDGQQAWVGGQYGLYWALPGDPLSIIYNLSFKNIRKEQGWGTNGAGFWIDHTGNPHPVRQILFENCYLVDLSAGTVGWHLRLIQAVTMINCMFTGTGTNYVVDAANVYQMQWVNMWISSTSANNLGVNTGTQTAATVRTGYTLPVSATWVI